jgi:hypothetical protein
MTKKQQTLELGAGAVVWTMPSLVCRLEVFNRQATDGLAAARMYALMAGLPSGVLGDVGLTGRPALDLENAEQLLQRQGCTVAHLIAASSKAWHAVWEWYTEAMPVSSEPGNDDPIAESPADTEG